MKREPPEIDVCRSPSEMEDIAKGTILGPYQYRLLDTEEEEDNEKIIVVSGILNKTMIEMD